MNAGIAAHRLFLGASLPDSLAADIAQGTQALRAETQGLAETTWLAPASHHVTLFFFGATHPLQVANITALCTLIAAKVPAFELVPERYALMPTAGAPRMLWLRFRPSPIYQAAVQAFQEKWEPLAPQLHVRNKPAPHTTLARIGTQAAPAWQYLPLPAAPAQPLPIERLTLWDSRPEGYIPLNEVKLRSRK